MVAWTTDLHVCREANICLSTCTGGEDGKVISFDLTTGEQVSSFHAATDTVNGFHFHPYLPLAATASGPHDDQPLHGMTKPACIEADCMQL